ncbi:hypothetical protein [Sorangium sp. So ce131]|uniref:hypothetical protein n=1 Tax=Sorangium sp. So ce131 TaxID=3133282 RepID=UPI003F5EF898
MLSDVLTVFAVVVLIALLWGLHRGRAPAAADPPSAAAPLPTGADAPPPASGARGVYYVRDPYTLAALGLRVTPAGGGLYAVTFQSEGTLLDARTPNARELHTTPEGHLLLARPTSEDPDAFWELALAPNPRAAGGWCGSCSAREHDHCTPPCSCVCAFGEKRATGLEGRVA